jgi:phosphoenolpyruvate-protein kinase (PTS system EI component)
MVEAVVVAVAEAVTAVVGFGPEHKMVGVHCGEAEGDSLAVKMVVEGIDVLSRSVQAVAIAGGQIP